MLDNVQMTPQANIQSQTAGLKQLDRLGLETTLSEPTATFETRQNTIEKTD